MHADMKSRVRPVGHQRGAAVAAARTGAGDDVGCPLLAGSRDFNYWSAQTHLVGELNNFAIPFRLMRK